MRVYLTLLQRRRARDGKYQKHIASERGSNSRRCRTTSIKWRFVHQEQERGIYVEDLGTLFRIRFYFSPVRKGMVKFLGSGLSAFYRHVFDLDKLSRCRAFLSNATFKAL